jgi:hypothetical protein
LQYKTLPIRGAEHGRDKNVTLFWAASLVDYNAPNNFFGNPFSAPATDSLPINAPATTVPILMSACRCGCEESQSEPRHQLEKA